MQTIAASWGADHGMRICIRSFAWKEAKAAYFTKQIDESVTMGSIAKP